MNANPHRRSHARGVSLIEALVALAVMAFGMLGMAGIQSSLRANSDIARQRAEATRIAQEAIERARSFTIVPVPAGTPDPNRVYYDGLTSVAAATVAGYTTNTTYSRTVTVVDTASQNYKTAVVDVAWLDRANTTHQVRLTSILQRTPPELAASLTVPGTGTAAELPGGRHPDIPRGAVDQGDGTSSYAPPGVSTTSLVFNNTSGLITKLCVPPAPCQDVTARLLAGFVLFSTGASAPGPAEAEAPASPTLPVSLSVAQSLPSSGVPAPQCFTATLASPQAVEYACLVHVDAAPPYVWSGQSLLNGLTLAGPGTEASLTAYRVCRYTPYRSNVAVGAVVPGVAPPVTLQNYDHPLHYTSVDRSFLDHNFLVIRAGDGTTPFACPADNTSTPFVNTNTFNHQPDTLT